MRSKILSRRILLIVIIIGLAFFLAVLFYSISKRSIQGNSTLPIENAVVLSRQEQANYGLPVRLKIPAINVDSLVEYVGLDPQGAMDVTKGPAEVAWFELGPRPGENGSAVIAGHSGWKRNIPAAFDNLYKLNKGDKISVEDEKGSAIIFVVREIKIYGKDEDASGVFGSIDGKAHLNLITCAGSLDIAKQVRADRLIVFTDKE